MINCCFCGKEIDEKYSNNTEPLMNGRCCNECNIEKVIPYRMIRLHNPIPKFIMTIGIPGSGKSYYANQLTNFIIISSDEYRKKMFGDVNCQSRNKELFEKIHEDIISALKSGKNVCFDATNIHKKDRVVLLEKLKETTCYKIAVCMYTPFQECIKHNSSRNRKVPDRVIYKMNADLEIPTEEEGFDFIEMRLPQT